MVGDEPTKSQTSSRSNSPAPTLSTGQQLTFPKETPGNNSSGDRRETRATSPASLPSELSFKVDTQVERIAALTALQESLPSCAPNVSLEEVKVYTHQLDEIHKAFLKDHSYFEAVWPTAHRKHAYFTDRMYLTESQLCLSIRLKLGKLKQELEPYQPGHSSKSCNSSSPPGMLPELALPTFTGNYLEWPAYSELFTALIGSSKTLTEIEKLQYLRSSLKGEPAQKVEALPLKGASFKPAWDLLSERYQNKRVLIQAQLDKLFSTQPVLNKNAAALTQLISTVEEAQTSLKSLGVAENLGDCILVHQVARQLDKSTREAWEDSLSSTQEYPTFKQIRQFVTGKARSLEMAEKATSKGSSTTQSLKKGVKSLEQRASSHQASQALPTQKSYQCDCCGGQHFIVTCPKFRSMSVQDRRKVVANNMLCYNCCGRHSSANCKSAHRCKQCGTQHHTMLHVQPSQPQSQREDTQSASQPH